MVVPDDLVPLLDVFGWSKARELVQPTKHFGEAQSAVGTEALTGLVG